MKLINYMLMKSQKKQLQYLIKKHGVHQILTERT